MSIISEIALESKKNTCQFGRRKRVVTVHEPSLGIQFQYFYCR